MDRDSIIEALTYAQGLPVKAIQAASENRHQLAPLFVEKIEEYVANPDPEKDVLIFFLFHMLGDYRCKEAYPTLARLLQLPPDRLYEALGDSLTETAHRVMANVFTGDPNPLYAIIESHKNNLFIRAGMFETLAMVVHHGLLSKDEAARYLKEVYSKLINALSGFLLGTSYLPYIGFVWYAWQRAIALLGLVDLVPLVRQAFDNQFMDPDDCDFHTFEHELKQTLDDPENSLWVRDPHYKLFDDTLQELSGWECFSIYPPNSTTKIEPSKRLGFRKRIPESRLNELCYCGSGKAFKDCCFPAPDRS